MKVNWINILTALNCFQVFVGMIFVFVGWLPKSFDIQYAFFTLCTASGIFAIVFRKRKISIPLSLFSSLAFFYIGYEMTISLHNQYW